MNLPSSPLQTGIRQKSLRGHCKFGRATALVFVFATGGNAALADNLTWTDGFGNGEWNTDTTAPNNWDNGGGDVPFAAGDDVTFDAGGRGEFGGDGEWRRRGRVDHI